MTRTFIYYKHPKYGRYKRIITTNTPEEKAACPSYDAVTHKRKVKRYEGQGNYSDGIKYTTRGNDFIVLSKRWPELKDQLCHSSMFNMDLIKDSKVLFRKTVTRNL